MTPCGVDRKRSFDQRLMMLPRLIRKVPGTIGEASAMARGGSIRSHIARNASK